MDSLFDSVIPAPRTAHRDHLVPVSVGSGLRSGDVEGAADPDVHVVLHSWRSTAELIIAKRPFCSRIVKPGYHLSQAVRDAKVVTATMVEATVAAGRRPNWIVGALVLAVAGLTVASSPTAVAAAQTQPAAAHAARAAYAAQAGDASRGDFAGLVEIKDGRRLYLECRGRGTPTVVLESGGGDAADIWSFRPPGFHQTPVLPAVARYTRVCAYDRPGTFQASGQPSRSDPVPLPRSAAQIVDLHALLRAARVPGPVRAGRPLVGWLV